MFDFDSFREIISTISKNKMRTFLTGLAVAWGIFMLIILLGVGNGFRSAATSNFSDRAKNTVTIYPGRTSMPYKGLPTNREIKFDNKDYDLIRTKIKEVAYVSALISQSATVSYEKEYGAWTLSGVSPDASVINNININAGDGRFINEIDMSGRRKVIVISSDMKKILFKDESPFGKHIIANGIAYQVIGVYNNKNQFENNPPAYIPFTTAQALYNKGYGFGEISFIVNGLKTEEANDAFVEKLRESIGQLHSFDPKDRSALYVWNTAANAVQAEQIAVIINIFILIIGAASLMAGVVGVGNIMLITVKERTKEIGIRKAIGATPRSILKLIIMESIFITATAGYVGLVIGVGVTELISMVFSQMGEGGGPNIFENVSVDLTTVFWATVVLIICGVGAGLMPALKATKVSPIEAMRAE